VCRYEQLGNDGLHSMYRWFEAYQEAHFPDPMGLRAMAHRCAHTQPVAVKDWLCMYIVQAIGIAEAA
jgi:hypothetical protein